jgi:anthranilate synthase component 2
MRALFVENDDSFSWNVIDALPLRRELIDIVPGADRQRARAALREASTLVIGPGPTDPVRAGLVDLVTLAAEWHVPTLGVCLGHQAIGLAFGATLLRLEPCHGKRATFRWGSSRLFPAFSGEITAMRYHSLGLKQLADPLRVIATTEDGIIMAMEHESLPIAGLQFHPDSFGTPRGRDLLACFFEAVR